MFPLKIHLKETMSDSMDKGDVPAPIWGDTDRESHEEERGMSVEELKHEMFRSLRDTGTIDAIRAQLRRRFIEKLKGHARRSEGHEEKPRTDWSVEEHVVHGLLYEYLVMHGMEHTLAVFVPEIGGKQELLGRDAIVTMLRLPGVQSESNEDKDNNQLAVNERRVEPLVLVLLKQLLQRLATVTMSSSTQTVVDCQDHRLALENQLRRVETAYLTECATQRNESSVKTFEERVLRYQREYDEICEKRLREDMERFKTTEMALMRVEERKKHDREIEALKVTLFQEHRERIQRLQDRERELEATFASRRSELETNLFEARQQLFQEIEKVRLKDQNLDHQHATEARQMTLEAKRLEMLEEKIKLREANMEATVQAMLEEKEHAWKLEKFRVMNEARAREEILATRERELEDRITCFRRETESTTELREQLTRIEVDVVELRAALAGAEKKAAILEAEKKALQGEIEAREEMLHEDKHNMKSLTYDNARISAELKAANCEVSKLEDVVVQRLSEVKELETEVKELHHQLITLKLSEANAIVEERQRLTKIIEEERDHARWKENELISRIRELQTRLAEVEAVAEKYQALYEDEKVHVEALRHEVSSLQTLLAQAQSAVTMKQQPYSRHTGNRMTSSEMGATDSSERMIMRMMEMMAQMATTQGGLLRAAAPSQTIARPFPDSSPQIPSDNEAKMLQREKERREQELLEEQEYQRKRQEREDQEKMELERRRKKFEEEMERERQQRANYEEKIEAERRKRVEEQEAALQAELERQGRAVEEAKRIQRRLLDEEIAREQKRLLEERQAEEERRSCERGGDIDTNYAETAPSLMSITDLTTSPADDQGGTNIDIHIPVDESGCLNHASASEEASRKETSSNLDKTATISDATQEGDSGAEDTSLIDVKSSVGSTDNSLTELERKSEENSRDHGQMLPQLELDKDNKSQGKHDIDDVAIPLADTIQTYDKNEESKPSSYEEDQPAVPENTEETLHEPNMNTEKDSSQQSEQQLEEDRRRAAEDAKKKEDEQALDAYRQRVLARREAERKRQEELEAQKRREEEARIHAEAAQASGDEMEESDGSFASSAASSSGSF